MEAAVKLACGVYMITVCVCVRVCVESIFKSQYKLSMILTISNSNSNLIYCSNFNCLTLITFVFRIRDSSIFRQSFSRCLSNNAVAKFKEVIPVNHGTSMCLYRDQKSSEPY